VFPSRRFVVHCFLARPFHANGKGERKSMRSYLQAIAIFLALSVGIALSQNQPGSQQKPPSSDQAQPAQTENPPHVDEDTYPEGRKVEATIQSALNQDPHMSYSRVSVHATPTEVTLTGIVLTQAAKDNAERIAQENAGNRKVNNKLRVNPNTNPGPGL
jgi:hypothetical protein